ELEQDEAFLKLMEAIRRAGSVAMRLADNLDWAAHVASIPKVAMISKPQEAMLISGKRLSIVDHDIAVRMISVGQPHRAVPITGAICLAVAARVAGSIPNAACLFENGSIRIGHASGTTQVDASVNAAGEAEYGAVYRTARRLFEGAVLCRRR
ncbi:MAG: PrpF domain-containing protein, partial [Novosphingobium sp.]|nr:PrpF domain-containing protein [Novosphingobium sp.]